MSVNKDQMGVYMTRREAREQAFVLLFEMLFKKDSVSETLESAREYREFEEDKLTMDIIGAVDAHLSEIDDTINRLSSKWRKERISKVSIATLRLAIAEMLYLEDVPVSVSINEAVELCKKYATTEDSAFVNGILGSLSKECEVK